jgi:hypothetical protein
MHARLTLASHPLLMLIVPLCTHYVNRLEVSSITLAACKGLYYQTISPIMANIEPMILDPLGGIHPQLAINKLQ